MADADLLGDVRKRAAFPSHRHDRFDFARKQAHASGDLRIYEFLAMCGPTRIACDVSTLRCRKACAMLDAEGPAEARFLGLFR